MKTKIKISLKHYIVMLFVLLCFCHTKVSAQKNYTVSETDTGALCIYEGDSLLTNVYITLKKTTTGYAVVKPLTSNSELYYIGSDGTGLRYWGEGYVTIRYNEKNNRYWSHKGTLLTNQIVGNKKAGYKYADATGIIVKDAVVQDAVDFVMKHSKVSDSREKRLQSCYQYLWKNYSYKRFYDNLYPKAKNMRSFAKYMFENKKGNCHRYAASFAYIAKVLGYDSKVAVGSISGRFGGRTPHGWTLVKNGKKWLVCDPDMELNGVHDYMKKQGSCSNKAKWICTLTIKNGIVKWK